MRGKRGRATCGAVANGGDDARRLACVQRPSFVEIEINPLAVYPDGALALDALVVMAG